MFLFVDGRSLIRKKSSLIHRVILSTSRLCAFTRLHMHSLYVYRNTYDVYEHVFRKMKIENQISIMNEHRGNEITVHRNVRNLSIFHYFE